MQHFDAASVAALQAAVAARCIAFTLTAQSTSQPYIDHAIGPFTRPIGPAPYVLLTATATYRTPDQFLTEQAGQDQNGVPVYRKVQYAGVQRDFGPGGCQVVCDASSQTVATGLLLQWVQAQLDIFGLRNPSMLTPARVP